jgi:hypothetical protein
MPRDGSGIYTTPAGTTAVPDTTIESAKYNANVNDVAADLNAPRPIVAGGTGGNSAATARANLGAEVRGVQVTNYDTHVFEAGSFYSLSTATAGPVDGQSFLGICYGSDDANITVEARNYSDTVKPNRKYIRSRAGGAWQAPWALEGSSSFVELAGDTMTGDLSIAKASPGIALNKTASGQQNYLAGNLNAAARWWIRPGDDVAESGANAGSNFSLVRFSDAGAFLGAPLSISRVDGAATFEGNVSLGANVGATSPAIRLHNGTGNASILQKSGADLIVRAQEGGPGAIFYGTTGNFACAGITSSGMSASGPVTATTFTASAGQSTFAMPLYIGSGAFNPGYSLNINCGSNYAMVVKPAVDGLNAITFQNAAVAQVGAISCSSTTTNYGTTSDAELKEDLKSFDAGNIIDGTNVYDFAWKSTGERAFGVIAQQAIEVYPTAVIHTEGNEKDERDEWWGVDYSKYVPVLLQELKALRARVAQLEGRTDTKPPPS